MPKVGIHTNNMKKIKTFGAVYPDKFEDKLPIGLETMPFFYLHGLLEQVGGYDTCVGNIRALYACTRKGITLTMFKCGELRIPSAIFADTTTHGMHGYIVALQDKVALVEAMEKFPAVAGMWFDYEWDVIFTMHPDLSKVRHQLLIKQ